MSDPAQPELQQQDGQAPVEAAQPAGAPDQQLADAAPAPEAAPAPDGVDMGGVEGQPMDGGVMDMDGQQQMMQGDPAMQQQYMEAQQQQQMMMQPGQYTQEEMEVSLAATARSLRSSIKAALPRGERLLQECEEAWWQLEW